MVEQEGHGTRHAVALDRDERLAELVLMGLRTRDGIPHERFISEAGKPLEECLNIGTFQTYLELNLIENDQGVLRTTAAGRSRLNTIVDGLVA